MNTPTPKNSVEERFDERFPPTFRRDNKDWIELNSYAGTPQAIKSFINQELLTQKQAILAIVEGEGHQQEDGTIWCNMDTIKNKIEGV